MTLGNETDAAYALIRRMPFLESGGFRRAHLKDGIVYKVNHEFGGEDHNLEEWNNLQLIDTSTLPDWIRIPKADLWIINSRTVMAMEYVDGEPVSECYCDTLGGEECDEYCLPDEVCAAIFDATGISDLGYGNVIRNGRVLYLVDLGV
jgi:hypothetical protein